MEKRNIEEWYDQNKLLYEDFVGRVEDLLKTLLRQAGIPYHSVNGRLKERASCVEKCVRKEYKTPEQMMDLAGLRIITHTTAEVQRVCEVIEREFQVDAENSGNKAQDMGVDKVGYLSVHYIVQMSPKRLELPEYSRFKGIRCEIQVRSLLQHAWAEIEHDRSYKFAGVLPEEIQRKFYLVAGTLELMDQEFCTLSREIDAYAKHVKKETKKGNLDIPIDSTSLLQFLNDFFKAHHPEKLANNYQSTSDEVIGELRDFGIGTLRQLKELLDKKSAATWVEGHAGYTGYINYIGILRSAMIIEDARLYFGKAWKENWTGMNKTVLDYWKENGVDFDSLTDIIKIKRDTAFGEECKYTIELR